jgi:proteasome-associated ATPase
MEFALFMQTLNRQPESVRTAVLQTCVKTYAKTNPEYLRKLQKEHELLTTTPRQIAVLESISDDKLSDRLAMVRDGNTLYEVAISGDVTQEELVPGCRVVLPKMAGAIIGTRGLPPACPTAEFERVLDDGRLLMKTGSDYCVLACGGELIDNESVKKLKPGDLLEYDPSVNHAIRIAHKSVRTAQYLGESPDVTWDDIGGMDQVRETIEREVLGPLLHSKTYGFYGVKPPRGVLFEGAPGVGKTMMIKAMGTSLLAALNLPKDAPVLYQIKGSSLLSSFVGEGPARIRAVGATAREAAKDYGLAIVLLDDFEYGGGLQRGLGDRSSPAYSNLTAALISEMEGLDGQAQIIFAATANRVDLVDSALLRAGRFSKKITVPRPNPETCMKILQVHLRDKPLAAGNSLDELTEKVVQQIFSYHDDNLLLRLTFLDGGQDEIFPPRIISGAILAEAVRCAGLRAVKRDLAQSLQQPGGITFDDLAEALDEQFGLTVNAIQPSNAHMHYLDLPPSRRVADVENLWKYRRELVA